MRYWLENKYQSLHPAASPPWIPESAICVNGIAVWTTEYAGKGDCIFRIDYRKRMDEIPISRSIWHYPHSKETTEVDSCLENVLTKHLEESRIANSADGWKYKNRLVGAFPIYSFWSSRANMLKVYKKKKAFLTSFDEICSDKVVTLLVDPEYLMSEQFIESTKTFASLTQRLSTNSMNIRYDDLSHADDHFVGEIFQNRRICYLGFLPDGTLAIGWTKYDEKDDFYAEYGELSSQLFEFQEANVLGLNIGGMMNRTVFNLNNPLIKWLMLIKRAGEKGQSGLSPDQFRKTLEIVRNAVRYYPLEHREAFIRYLEQWQNSKKIPLKLRPPQTDIQEETILDIQTWYKGLKSRR